MVSTGGWMGGLEQWGVLWADIVSSWVARQAETLCSVQPALQVGEGMECVSPWPGEQSPSACGTEGTQVTALLSHPLSDSAHLGSLSPRQSQAVLHMCPSVHPISSQLSRGHPCSLPGVICLLLSSNPPLHVGLWVTAQPFLSIPETASLSPWAVPGRWMTGHCQQVKCGSLRMRPQPQEGSPFSPSMTVYLFLELGKLDLPHFPRSP